MNLDLPTLMVTQSFVVACAGAILLFAWLQHRAERAFALGGLGNISAAVGLISLMLGATLHQPVFSATGGFFMPLQSALLWKVARAIDSKRAPFWIVLAGPALGVLAGGLPLLREVPATISMVVGVVYSFAIAAVLWQGRGDGLKARWPLIGLSLAHGTTLVIGTCSTAMGITGQSAVPSIASLFGIVFFESMIFALGMSAFIVALIKERNEAASMAAARTDSLTGIANRAAFMVGAERVLERCRRDGTPVSVMMFDLDHFKMINDRHGHRVGDAVIKKFCAVTGEMLRPNDVFGRLGGEEFAIVLPACSVEAGYVRADRIRAAFADNCRFILDVRVNATVSAGVAGSPDGQQSLDQLLETSDLALYSAKADGRNRVNRAEQPKPAGGPTRVFRVA